MKRLFGALVATLLALPAQAADPIKMVVPFAAGGPVDALARIVAAEIGPRLQADVVIENRGGAGGLLAVDQVAASAPDGRTVLFASVGAFVVITATCGVCAPATIKVSKKGRTKVGTTFSSR